MFVHHFAYVSTASKQMSQAGILRCFHLLPSRMSRPTLYPSIAEIICYIAFIPDFMIGFVRFRSSRFPLQVCKLQLSRCASLGLPRQPSNAYPTPIPSHLSCLLIHLLCRSVDVSYLILLPVSDIESQIFNRFSRPVTAYIIYDLLANSLALLGVEVHIDVGKLGRGGGYG